MIALSHLHQFHPRASHKTNLMLGQQRQTIAPSVLNVPCVISERNAVI